MALLAFGSKTRQVLAFFVGDRSRESARKLWQRIPAAYRERATFYSDDWEAYKGVIPTERHVACGKESGLTSGIERFNYTLRQRVSRLVHKALSFSKRLANHIGAIKYFICHYNREGLFWCSLIFSGKNLISPRNNLIFHRQQVFTNNKVLP
jgi:insertion element IS1 protein InsB